MRLSFDLADLVSAPGYWFVSTPYKDWDDPDAAFQAAAKVTGALMKEGVSVFSPIVHGHPIALACDIDPYDYDIWHPQNRPMLDAAFGIIVVEMDGWEESEGIRDEIPAFRSTGRPVVRLDPTGIL
jgi:hypothetical protein